MTRSLDRNYSLRFIPIVIAILILSLAFVALAQTTRAARQSPSYPGGSAQMNAATLVPVAHFAKVVTYPSGGYQASSMAVADLNGDGHPDLVVANFCLTPDSPIINPRQPCLGQTGSVEVLLGNGDGTFQTAVSYSSGGVSPSSVAVADVDGDGKLDVVVVNQDSDSVSVLLGNGNGTLQTPVSYDSGGYDSLSVAIADLNGDGHPDLVVANTCFSYSDCSTGGVGVLLGNGDGTFQAPVTYSSGAASAHRVAIADLNGDGRPDLVVANCYVFCGVAVLLGNGDGTFQAPIVTGVGGYYLSSIAIGDVNADGHPDVVLTNCYSPFGCVGVVSVLLGNGDGTFQAPVNYNSGGYFPASVTIGDVNGDGKPDLVVANNCNDTNCTDTISGLVGVLLGNGDGTFQAAAAYRAGGYYANEVALADVNGDGRPDILVDNLWVNPSSIKGSVGVFLNLTEVAGVTKLSTSLSPSPINYPVTFTATTTSRVSIPDGISVTFYDGTNEIGTGSTKNGVASFTTSALTPGRHTIKAMYPGSGFSKASSGAVTQIVLNPYRTTTTLTSTLNPSIYGQAVTFTAKVTTTGSVPPTGRVAFRWSDYSLGSVPLDSNGVATLTRSKLNADLYPLTAVYSGDATNLGSTSATLSQLVEQTTSAAQITSSLNPSTEGQAVTFTATITSSTVMPTGPVTFRAGNTVLGTAQLSGGKAKFTTSSLPTGTTTISATYYGDSNIARSSASVAQTVH